MKKYYNRIKKTIHGYFIAKKLLREYPNMTIISSYCGIGDRVFCLAYLTEFLKEHGIRTYKVLSADPENSIYKQFGISEDNIVFLPRYKVICLNLFYTTDFGNVFRAKYSRLLSVSPDAFIRPVLYEYTDYLCYSDIVKAIFKISKDYVPFLSYKYLLEEKYYSFIKENNLIKNNTCIMNPYANSCDSVPISFFQKIADLLIDIGFSVVTSTVGAQKPLQGTVALDFDLRNAIALCDYCGCVIGQRSGFMDLISFSEAHIISIDSFDYPHSGFFRLEDCWKQNSNINTVTYGKEDESQILDKIKNIVVGIKR